jgi:transposase
MAAHQRFLLTEQLCHIDALDDGIARVSAEITERMRPFAEAIERLDTIPGIGQRMAEILVAEIGVDMTRFPSAAHLASWAGCALATRRAPVNASVARPAKATSGCGQPD